MNNKETHGVIRFLNASWTQNKLDPETAAIWGAELMRFELAEVMTVLTGLLRTAKWRPSLAEIIEPLVVPDEGESSSEAFAAVWSAMGRVGAHGDPALSDRATRAVKHLGGWHTVCRIWSIHELAWHRKEFIREFESLETRDAREHVRALSGPKRAAGPARLDASAFTQGLRAVATRERDEPRAPSED